MLYDTVLLRTFAAICDLGSFTKAAREVRPDAVGRQPARQTSGRSGRLAAHRAQHPRHLADRARRSLPLVRAAHTGACTRRPRIACRTIAAASSASVHRNISICDRCSRRSTSSPARYPTIQRQLELGLCPDIAAHARCRRARHRHREQRNRRKRRRFTVPRATCGRPAARCSSTLKSRAPLALVSGPSAAGGSADARPARSRRPHVDSGGFRARAPPASRGARTRASAITVLPEYSLPSTLRMLGSAEALPALPDFEFVLAVGRGCRAAEPLADMIISLLPSPRRACGAVTEAFQHSLAVGLIRAMSRCQDEHRHQCSGGRRSRAPSAARSIPIRRSTSRNATGCSHAAGCIYATRVRFPDPAISATAYIAEDPVIVSGVTPAGVVRAFLNVCSSSRQPPLSGGQRQRRHIHLPLPRLGLRQRRDIEREFLTQQAYRGELDLERWPLISVAQLDIYKGLIFATFDASAAALARVSGRATRGIWMRFSIRAKAVIEIFLGVNKWIVPCNWKIAAENFSGDSYHVPWNHRSAMDRGIQRAPAAAKRYQPILIFISATAIASWRRQPGSTHPAPPAAATSRKAVRAVRDSGPASISCRPGIATVVPELRRFFDGTAGTSMRVWHPRDPIERDLVVDLRRPARRHLPSRKRFAVASLRSFGPAGTSEQTMTSTTGGNARRPPKA